MRQITTLCLVILIAIHCAFGDRCTVTKFEEIEEALKCQRITLDNLQVPAGLTLKLNLTDNAEVIFRGNISFGFKHWDGPLVTINGTGITVRGESSSVLDGLGQSYWDGQGGWSNQKPQFFTIQAFGGSIFRDIRVINTPKDVVQITNSDDVVFANWLIDDSLGDPGKAEKGREGHNTDAFDVWNSTNVVIKDSVVYNQDDCVALRCGSNILVSNLYCHGSHGLSISAGFSNDSVALNTVMNVTFSDSIMDSGSNGIHVKTHIDGGFGNITGVVYRNITLKGIQNNGILIEQNYTNKPPQNVTLVEAAKPRNNVPIRDLALIDVTGTVNKKATPVQIVCADEGCYGWNWLGVDVEGGKSNRCNFAPQGFVC